MKRILYLFIISFFLQANLFAQVPSINYAPPQNFQVGSSILPIIPTNTGGEITYGLVSTLAGSGTLGSTDAASNLARFNSPSGVAVDASGNVCVADTRNNKIRIILTTGSVISLTGGVQGDTNGTVALAKFHSPCGVALDANGNVYVADTNNHKIKKITQVVSTWAGSGIQGSIDSSRDLARFSYPNGVTVDISGNVYVADTRNQRIRKISPSGVVSTLAGSGSAGSKDATGNLASFYSPNGVAVDILGNVYVADSNNNKIRKISPSGVVSTLAGSGLSGSTDGNGSSASFYYPTSVAVDATGNIYVADLFNSKIRKISPSGIVSTLAGGVLGSADGLGSSAKFKMPIGIAVDATGNVYVADSEDNKIRKINTYGGYSISPQLPAGLSMDSSTGTISGTPTVVSAQNTYTVSATNSYGTSSTTIVITVDSNLGVDDVNFKNMVIHPNPTNGVVIINDVFLDKVNVYNNAGQLVKIITNKEATSNTSVDLNNLPTGIYYLNIESGDTHTVKQIIKQ